MRFAARVALVALAATSASAVTLSSPQGPTHAAQQQAKPTQKQGAKALVSKAPARRQSAQLRSEPISSLPMLMYRQDCWKRRPVSLAQAKVPGAGVDQESIQPFQTVLKDGFFEVDCVKDYLFEHGDKYGNNKYSYELASVSNVSIVLYNELVPKQDRKPMSHSVCFSFCRTVPDMMFFGLLNGRSCYCAPYYKPMAGDDSMCDVPCEGNPTMMCGGKAKSSIFEMHMCGTSSSELAEAAQRVVTVSGQLAALQGQVTAAAAAMQSVAAEMQQKLGLAGDPTASALMQAAKVFAGELQHAAEAAGKQVVELTALHAAAAALAEGDASSFDAASKMEELTEKSDKAVAAAEAAADELAELLEKVWPSAPGTGAGAQYHPVMYFVDKSFVEVPSTCGGTEVGRPLVGTFDSCANACDADVHSCVGFNFFPDTSLQARPKHEGQNQQTQQQGGPEHGLCFLFSKLSSTTYYTGCGAAASFLQRAPHSEGTKCVAKLSHFEGTTLAPDASGKCEQCLKSATKADRCFA